MRIEKNVISLTIVLILLDSPFMLAGSRAAAIECWSVPRDRKITGQWIRTIQKEAPDESNIFSQKIFQDAHDVLKPKQDDALEMFVQSCVDKVS